MALRNSSSSERRSPAADVSDYVKVDVKSPSGGKQGGGGNMTGYPRKVRDNCADLYNNIQKWNKYNAKGKDLITTISNIKLSQESSKDDAVSAENLGASRDADAPLRAASQQLSAVVSHMQQVLSRLEQTSRSLQLVARLCAAHPTDPTPQAPPPPPFLTWSYARFAAAGADIVGMLRREAEVKVCVSEQVAHVAGGREQLVLYAALWYQQGYVDDTRLNLLLTAMLCETGLRQANDLN